MGVKIVLSLIALCCFCLAECCGRNSVNACKDDARCNIHNTNTHGKSKRSIIKNRTLYSLTLAADPCDFETYDLNKDDAISKEEFYLVLSKQDETDELFAKLDVSAVDNVITQDEFDTISPSVIANCFIPKH